MIGIGDPLERGPLASPGDSTLDVKLGLVALVLVLIGAHMRRPEGHILDAAIFLSSLAIVWLGIVVAG